METTDCVKKQILSSVAFFKAGRILFFGDTPIFNTLKVSAKTSFTLAGSLCPSFQKAVIPETMSSLAGPFWHLSSRVQQE